MTDSTSDLFGRLSDKMTALVASGAPVRRWSFEIEHIAVGETRRKFDWDTTKLWNFVMDGSVNVDYDNCECSCRDCQYHECNCDDCENYNDSPDHCADFECTANECSPVSPLRTAWNGDFTAFLRTMEESASYYRHEDFGRLGGHLHAEGRDLTKVQVRSVLVMMNHVFNIAPEWFTGVQDDYNRPMSREELDKWTARDGEVYPRRDAQISIHNLSSRHEPQEYSPTSSDNWDGRKTTIEFRRFRTSFDPEILTIRGGVVRAVIAYAKTDAPIYWVTRSKDFEEALEAVGFGSY